MRFYRLTWDEACCELAGMVGNPKWDVSGGMYGVRDLIGGGVAYRVSDDQGPLVVLVLEKVRFAGGQELVVRAAAQLAASGDITERVLPEIERRYGFDCAGITIWTKRAGLVEKLDRAGYTVAAKMMRKKLR